jgi:hypothetical protein
MARIRIAMTSGINDDIYTMYLPKSRYFSLLLGSRRRSLSISHGCLRCKDSGFALSSIPRHSSNYHPGESKTPNMSYSIEYSPEGLCPNIRCLGLERSVSQLNQ